MVAAPFHRILIDTQSAASTKLVDQGWRLRLSRIEDDQPAELVEEQVLPEKVNQPIVNLTRATLGTVKLRTAEVRWLIAALSELLPSMEADDARWNAPSPDDHVDSPGPSPESPAEEVGQSTMGPPL